VDIAIIETGLGGRLDSTNIISPELSVITNISFDHMQLLGDTLGKIAGEKAGIIKEKTPVVIGERQEESEDVFIRRAAALQAPLYFASDNVRVEFLSQSESDQKFRIYKGEELQLDELSLELRGKYQSKNIVTVLQSLEILEEKFPLIKEESIRSGLISIHANTGLQGRWQVIGKNPLTIADVAHNEEGISYVMEQLETLMTSIKIKGQETILKDEERGTRVFLKQELKEEIIHQPVVLVDPRLHIVFGLVNDKNPSSVLSHLPAHAIYYFCKASIPRALDADELKKAASEFQLEGASYNTVEAAFNAAKNAAGENDIVFVGGSTFVVAEIV
jgi:dihydrofolate synthase/folylpolyglutamate synthase